MRVKTSLRRALEDPAIFGSILAGDSFMPWRTLLIGAFGEPLSPGEEEVFRTLTGGRPSNTVTLAELWAVVGRRGGKDRAVSVLAAYLATCIDYSDILSVGEVGTLLVVAPDRRQAQGTLGYIKGALDASPVLASMIANTTQESIELDNRVTIEVRSSNFRRMRGITAIAVVLNEVAFFLSDEAANPDVEILRAVRPMLATTHGPLVAISSPYARKGELWLAFDRNFGLRKDGQIKGSPRILVAQASTETLNPTIDLDWLAEQYKADPEAAAAEYGAKFRSDIQDFVSLDAIRACVIADRIELPPNRAMKHVAFVDPSGGSSDSFCLAIAHREVDTIVIDCLREVKPPFSPEQVVEELSDIVKRYRLTKVVGDAYSGEFVRELFRKNGLNYELSERNKSELFLDLLAQINSRAIDLPDNERLVRQLQGLERHTGRGGRDTVDHAPGGHDDLANALAGAAFLAANSRWTPWGRGIIPAPDAPGIHIGNLAGEHGMAGLPGGAVVTRAPKVVRGYDQQKRDHRRY